MKPTNQTELVAVGQQLPSVVQPHPGLSLESAYQAVVDGNLDAEKLAVLKDLLAMNAQRQFAVAFNALQSELPTIVASTVIPNRGKYEKFEDVMKAVGPILHRNGFTVSFSMDFKDNRVIETCHLNHVGGHSQSNSFAVRSGKADTDTQADCKAATTAKRNSLLNALNIVIRQDCLTDESDAAIEGDPNAKLTTAQADELEKRAQLTNSNIPAFLKFAGAAKFADIPASKYTELDAMLRRKEQGGR